MTLPFVHLHVFADQKNDKSVNWVPKLYFQDKANNTFEDVPMFYMNVYYL